jgi:hypothetical protein
MPDEIFGPLGKGRAGKSVRVAPSELFGALPELNFTCGVRLKGEEGRVT